MKVGIIGGGFTGLAAGLELSEQGVEVKILEKDLVVGGLASNFCPKGWRWGLEKYYHHIFTNDKEAIKLGQRVGWPAKFYRLKTNNFVNNKERQLDSLVSLLKYDELNWGARIRMGLGLGILRLIRKGQWLEKYKVNKALPLILGREGYEKVWKRLLRAKFGPYLDRVNLAWFWARVVKRTSRLGYFDGGLGKLAERVKKRIEQAGGQVMLGTKIKEIKKEKQGWLVNGEKFDQVLITIPGPLVNRLFKKEMIEDPRIDYLWGQVLILEMDESLMKGYWLNMLGKDWPFLVVVEQTNLVDKKYYGEKTIVYLGNYLADDDKKLQMTEEELLALYLPYLKKINKAFDKKWVTRKWIFKDKYAQPVFPINYSKKILKIRTNFHGLFVANMSMVYPWDRGINQAIKMGKEVAKIMIEEIK